MAQARLDGINQELKSAGFKELGPLCYCESNSVDSIFEVYIEPNKASKA